MAATDLIALIATLVIVGGVIYVVLYVSRGFQDTVQTTKESLKSRGFDVSGSGISIKTDKRFDREAYLDATQRGMVSILGASSIGRSVSPNRAHATMTTAAHSNGGETTQGEREHKGHRDHFWKASQHEERHRKPWEHFRKGKHPEQEVL